VQQEHITDKNTCWCDSTYKNVYERKCNRWSVWSPSSILEQFIWTVKCTKWCCLWFPKINHPVVHSYRLLQHWELLRYSNLTEYVNQEI